MQGAVFCKQSVKVLLADDQAARQKYAADLTAYKTAEAAWEASLAQALMKLAPDSLKNYDGLIFCSTTGDLPIPDKEGLLAWIREGHAFGSDQRGRKICSSELFQIHFLWRRQKGVRICNLLFCQAYFCRYEPG